MWAHSGKGLPPPVDSGVKAAFSQCRYFTHLVEAQYGNNSGDSATPKAQSMAVLLSSLACLHARCTLMGVWRIVRGDEQTK